MCWTFMLPLMPCVIGYAEIGNRLTLEYESQLAENPYREMDRNVQL